MKKKILLILLTLLLVPKLTYAEELPREGVHYFLNYPNDEEVVTKNYDEIENEILLYNGKTNDNGEIILTDWNEYGQLRIVQKVPSGYSTDQKEIIVDLSDKKASFVNYRGITNPETGRSILLTTILLGTIISLIILVKTKDKKKYLLIIPLITLLCLNVKAESEGFVISVKDKQGNSLKDVEISVYAKPNKKEAYPAAEIHANGGKFLNREEIMYIKLDSNGRPLLPGNQIELEINLVGNITLAHKDGYKLDENSFFSSIENNLTNDTVINLEWVESTQTKLIKIYGNGEKFKISGKKLDYIEVDENKFGNTLRDSASLISIRDYFLENKSNNYLVGLDFNKNCSNYDSHGYFNLSTETPDDIKELYLCWNKKPDGIYVNNKNIAVGKIDSCFNSNSMTFFYNNVLKITTLENLFEIDLNNNILGMCVDGPTAICQEIDTIEMIENGNTVISLTSADLESDIDKSDRIEYHLKNQEGLRNYFSSKTTECRGGRIVN